MLLSFFGFPFRQLEKSQEPEDAPIPGIALRQRLEDLLSPDKLPGLTECAGQSQTSLTRFRDLIARRLKRHHSLLRIGQHTGRIHTLECRIGGIQCDHRQVVVVRLNRFHVVARFERQQIPAEIDAGRWTRCAGFQRDHFPQHPKQLLGHLFGGFEAIVGPSPP